MPNKYPEKKGWKVPKQKFKVTNWSVYNKALCRRGGITVWLSEDVISQWYKTDRVYDGTGTPRLYTDFSIITCHEIRLVYKLPLDKCLDRMSLTCILMRLMKLSSENNIMRMFKKGQFNCRMYGNRNEVSFINEQFGLYS